MFLSDKLLEIGSEANSNDVASEARQCDEMHAVLVKEKENGICQKKLSNIMISVIRKLNKMGYLYYTMELFFKKNY